MEITRMAKGEIIVELQIQIEGCQEKVTEFVDALKCLPQWRLYSGSKVSLSEDNLQITYLFEDLPYQKPSISRRNVSKLMITSETGEKFDLVLLDAEVVKMDKGMTYIHGRSYDIF
jgi:hypothetical protein